MGTVVLSIDAELGWGYHDLVDRPAERVEAGRPGWRRLVELLDRFDVPATWAIVGHLFLEDCDGEHADHPAPAGWFERERNAWRNRPDLRFGPDLVDAVRHADADHEVASHTFSHVVFDERTTDRDLARAELEAARRVAGAHGLDPTSIVFPRNVVGHRDLLAEYGFRSYRGASPVNQSSSSFRRRVLRLTRGFDVGEELLLAEPSVDEYGLVNVPASMYLYSFEGRIRDFVAPVVGDPVLTQVKRGIDRAGRRDGLFHLWLHPNDLVREYTVDRLRDVLSYVAERRDEGLVTVETMADVAARMRTTRGQPVTTVDGAIDGNA